jgi:RHS repeat-associated protein
MVTRSYGGTTYTLTYDAENHMTGMTGGGVSASFVYDGDGNRVKATIGTTTTYVGNYFEWTGSTSTMKKYYYSGGIRVAMRTGTNNPLWLLGDHLGSTSTVANFDGGSVQSQQLYKPWGEKRYPTGAPTLPTTFRYTGQRSETGLGPSGGEGLMFYGARWFDPSLARFIQADSIVPIAVNHSENLSQMLMMLIVDYHENSLLMQFNKVNQDNSLYKNINDDQSMASDKGKTLNNAITQNGDNKTQRNDRREQEQSDEDFEKIEKIGRLLEENSNNYQSNEYHKSGARPNIIDPTSMDRFAYTSNCPTKYTDPSGHCNVVEFIAGAGIIIVTEIIFSLPYIAGFVQFIETGTFTPPTSAQIELEEKVVLPLNAIGLGIIMHSQCVSLK